MSFKVLQAGFAASIQDTGRLGQQAFGLTPCGALDDISARLGNWLLDNPPSAAVLEIPYGHCRLKADADTLIAVTGADLGFQINHQSAERYQLLSVHAGDELCWSAPKHTAVRAYLAVLGGFQTECYFGSRAVSFRERIGQPLQAGQTLATSPTDFSKQTPPPTKTIPQSLLPKCHDPLWLRVLPTYQNERFSATARAQFFSQTYRIGNQFDRTACRLEGKAIDTPENTLLSEGMTEGAIQITHQGQPIIMLKERPTIGGYPKIGTVFSLDLANLAQAMPGTPVRFKPISLKAAQLKRQALDRFFQADNLST